MFYFTFFAVFAIPFKLFKALANRKNQESNFMLPRKQMASFDDFQNEF